jgi:hypothetical protein
VIYLFAFIVSFAGMGLGTPRTERNELAGLGLLLALCLLASLRLDTGTDFQTYTDIWRATPPFRNLQLDDVTTGFYEPLFFVTTSVLKGISDNQSLFFAFYACATLVILHAGLRRFQINQSYAYLLYFCVFYLPYLFNAMRQAVAMSLFIAALPAILQRRSGKVLLLSLVAGGFHVSGLLIGIGYLFLLGARALGLTARGVFAVVAGVGGALALSGAAGRLFFAAFPGATEAYSEIFDTASSPASVAIRLGLALLMLSLPPRDPDARKKVDDLLIVYLLGLLVYLALLEFNVLATRFNMLFRVLEVVLLPLIARHQTGWKRTVFVGMTLVMAVASLLSIANDPDYEYQPIPIL